MYLLEYLFKYISHRMGALCDSSIITPVSGFINHLQAKENHPQALALIEKYRSEVYNDTTALKEFGLGAGTRRGKNRKTVGDLARMASTSRKFGKLLFDLADYFHPPLIIELGTAVGISTMYLAAGNPNARVITVEGNPQLADRASKAFAAYGLENIRVMNMHFDDFLEKIKVEIDPGTLVFIDGNHTEFATWHYFKVFGLQEKVDTMLIFDDIHWSRGMMKTWKRITGSPRAGIIIDFFHMGILFQGAGIQKQKVRVRL
jgi:predicted O-methyltransferase YrrM